MNIGSLTGSIVLEDKFSEVLNHVTGEVKSFAKDIEGGFGKVALGAIGVAGAIAGITGSIIALGNRGADVNDVTATFETFSGSVKNADDTLRKMQEGTLNTVDDMDLMKDASRLLAAGVKLSADQFGTLSQAAFVLQNQGLGPTKEMLDLVSQALLTGRTRTLEMKIGKIDLAKAEKEYAASLGVEKLTRMQKAEADRIAILEALNKKVKEAGEQHRDFGESMEAAVVAFKNWGDELASAVAKSPSVLNAVEAIGNAITKNFGGAGQTALEVIVGWINKFANAVAYYGPPIIKVMADVVTKVEEIYKSITTAWNTAPDWFKAIAKEAAIAAIAVGSVHVATKELTGQDILTDAAALANIYQGFGSAATKAIVQIGGVYNALKVYYLLGSFAGGGISGGVAGILTGISYGISLLLVPAAITASIAALGASIWQLVKAFEALRDAQKQGTSFGTFIARQDKDNFVRRALGLSTANMPTAPGAPSIFAGSGAMPHVNISQGTTAAGSQASKILSEADSAAIEEYNKKLEAMQQKFKDASLEGRLFVDTFNSLTSAQKNNYDIQKMIVPELEKMVEAHKALTPEMQRVLTTSMALEQAYLDQENTTLQLSGLTQEAVDRAKEQGYTETQVANSYGVSTKALGLYLEQKKKDLTISESLAAFENARVQDEAAYQRRKTDLALQGNKTLGESAKELQDLIDKRVLDSTDYQIKQVQRAEAEKVAAFKGTTEQIKAYTEEQAQVAQEKYNQISLASSQAAMKMAVDAGAVESAWKKALFDIPNLVKAALTGGGGLKGALSATLSDLGASIGDKLFSGKMAQGLVDKIGGTLGSGLAAIFPGIGSAIGSLIGPALTGLGKLLGIGPTEYEKRVRAAAAEMSKLKDEVLKSHGGMEQLIHDANRVGINIKEAFNWKDPEAFKKVVEDLDGAIERMNEGIKSFAEGAIKRADSFFHAFDKVRELKDKYKDILPTADEIDSGETKKALAEINHAWLNSLGGTIDDVQKEFARVTLYVGTGFAQMLQQSGVQAALQEFAGTFDQLISLNQEFGFQIDDTTNRFIKLYQESKDNQDVLSSVDALTQMIKGAGDALFINQDLMNAFAEDAITDFTRLTERGVDANDALILMQPTLQSLWEAQHKFGLQVDDSTQKLLDQAEQQGLIGENMKDINEQILDVLKGIAEVLGAKIPNAFDKAADAAGRLGKAVGDIPPVPSYDDTDTPHFAGGGVVPPTFSPRGTDTILAAVSPGERITSTRDSQGNWEARVVVPLYMDDRKVAEGIVKVARRL